MRLFNVKFNEDEHTRHSGVVIGPWCELEEGINNRMGVVDNSPNFCPEPSPVDTNSDKDDIPVQQIANELTDSSSSHTFDDS